MLNSFKEIIKNHVSKNNYKKLRNIYIKLKNIFYFGNKYRCPCCNKNFRKFQNFYYKRNLFYKSIYKYFYKNTVCPFCYSLPRHRIICEYLNNNLNLINNKKILIFSIEDSTEIYLKNKNINFYTADLYQEADYKIDIQNINLQNECFDLIFCNHILEHVENHQKALIELKRILSKNGVLILSVPINRNLKKTYEVKAKSFEERKKRFGQGDHLKLFSLNFKNEIEKLGFKVTELNGDNFNEKIRPVTGPSKYDLNYIFICTKK